MADIPESMREAMRRIAEGMALPWACGTCRWWHTPDGQKGLCRAKPPTPGANGDAVWPRSSKHDWCGQHDPEDDDDA